MSPPSDPRQQALAAGARFAQGGSLNCDAAAAQWFQTGEASALECAAALGAVAAEAAFVVGFRDERAAMLKIVNKTVTLRRSSGAVVGSRTLPTSYRDRPPTLRAPWPCGARSGPRCMNTRGGPRSFCSATRWTRWRRVGCEPLPPARHRCAARRPALRREAVVSPEQIETARRAMDLPGWGFTAPESHKMEPRRSQRGILWVRSSHPRGPWVPDLMDYSGATDGVFLRLLGDGWTMGRTSEGRVRLFVSKQPGKAVLTLHESATLAEACCLCAIDLGRWPGGVQ